MALVPLTVACVAMVSAHVGVPQKALAGLLNVERGAVGHVTPNYGKDGSLASVDIGPFQINDKAWLGYFTTAWHLETSDQAFILLRDNGCANALAGAVVLKSYLDQANGNTALAIGWYNSHNPVKAAAYKKRFVEAYLKIKYRPGRGTG